MKFRCVLFLFFLMPLSVVTQAQKIGKMITPNVQESKNIEILKNRLYSQRKNYLRKLRGRADAHEVYKIQANIQKLEILIADLEYENKKMGKPLARQEESRFTYKGHLQFRTESAKNLRAVQGSRQTEQSLLRLRANVSYTANENLRFNLTPQATKGFGANDASGKPTSGSTEHTELDFFEANFDFHLTDKLSARIGRQAVSYGDELVIGTLPWSNTGRSFDALRLTYDSKFGSSELLYSKVDDNSTPTVSTDDQNFISFYNSFDFGPRAREVDLYYMQLRSGKPSGVKVNSFGFRVKGKALGLFYRTENAYQSGANLGDDAFQYNVEVGKKMKRYKASLEYAVAGADYRQFFPTGHNFLGFADVLGRRNIKQVSLHLWGRPLRWLSFNIDYHSFKREDNSKSAFRLDGETAIGSNGNSDDIGSEMDFIVTLHSKSRVKLQLGSTWFNPGEYMRDQDIGRRDKVVNFNYVQVLASF